MKPQSYTWIGIICLVATLCWGCEISTAANGTVTDQSTDLPIAGARVIEFAVHRKTQEFVADAYTDSLGRLDAGLSGYGPQKTTLLLLISKDGYYSASIRNEGLDYNIGLRPR
jgi:hypothetical protein